MNKNYLNFTKILTLIAVVGLTFNYFAIKAGNFEVKAGNDRVTICHRTASHTNPYVKITVDADSVDGDLGNDKGQGDHYMEHLGPVWSSGIAQHIEWGDIIPVVQGDPGHNGLNLTIEGQEILANNCKAVEDQEDISDCTDENAIGYNPNANIDDGSCEYPEVTPTPTPNCEELENCEDPSPTPEVTPTPTPNSCDPEQSCPTNCGAGATDVANGSCGVKHCDPIPTCSESTPEPTTTPETSSPVGGRSQGQVLGATTDSYAAAGVASDLAFSLIGLTGTGLSSLGILLRRNEKKQ